MQHGEIFLDEAINWDCSLNDGLVSRWKVLPDHRRGVFFRDLCKVNHGTLTNGPTWSGNAPRGGFGSLAFDGTDDHVLATSMPLSYGVNGLSIFGNINVTGSLSGWRSVCGDYATSTSNPTYFHVCRANAPFNGGYGIEWRGTSVADPGVVCGVASTFPSGWKNYGFTLDNSTIRLYLDGVEVANTSNTKGLLTSGYVTAFYIGAAYYLGVVDLIAKKIESISVWDRALSASEVAALYEDSLAGSPKTLNWYRRKVYSFTEAAAASGNPWNYYAQMAG